MRLVPALVVLAGTIWAQQTFEVASIRLSEPVTREDGSPRIQFEGSNFIARGYPLMRLILHAYDLQEYQVTGGERWMNLDRYDVSAKVPDGDDPSLGANRLRLRALLAERFGLKVHSETKQATILALVVSKGGVKLTPHLQGAPDRTSSGLAQVTGRNADMKMLARILSARLGQQVVDRTGLTGTFDFQLKWEADRDKGTGPTVFTALQEQLGLRLDSEKGPMEVLVVDRAEKPTDN